MHTLIWIGSALIAGMIARIVTRGQSRGFMADAALGAVGSVAGAWLLRELYGEVPATNVENLVTTIIGAILLVAAGRATQRAMQHVATVTPVAAPPDMATLWRQLSEAERAVVDRVLRLSGITTQDPDKVFQSQLSFGERLADRIATFGGSWSFLGFFFAFMLGWMFINTQAAQPVDPYPFILLNLVLSCLAAIQAPVIMMSQNRQSAKDRFDAKQDYDVNLRAELQIASLHQVLEEARRSEWAKIAALQEEQLALLRAMAERDARA